MNNKEKVFRWNPNSLSRVTRKLADQPGRYDKIMFKRMTAATQIVWATAHARRPMMNRQQAKAHGSRVSLPDPYYTKRGLVSGMQFNKGDFSIFGVPVRTGALQMSIQKEVKRGKGGVGSWVGRIWTQGIHYASYIEFGTSRMAARPFMRPAVAENKDYLKKQFGVSAQNENA